MLVEAAQAASYAGDAAQIVEIGRRASALPSDSDPDRRSPSCLVGIGNMFSGDTARGAPQLPRCSASRRTSKIPGASFTRARAPAIRGGSAEHEFYGRAVDQARGIGAVSRLPYVLEYLAHAEAVEGRYAAATTHASEGLRLASETGQRNSVCHLLASLALITALQGAEAECRPMPPRRSS